MHQKASHGVKHSGPGLKFAPCKQKVPDTMSLNVHNLKKHPIIFKCTQCDNMFKENELLVNHIKNNHTEIEEKN